MTDNFDQIRDSERLAAVDETELIGSPPDDAFDRLIELATELTGIPRGCITLVDAHRSNAISAVGYPEGTTVEPPIEQSFCRYVVRSSRPLIVNDARSDPRTAGDPAIDEFGVAAWIGYAVEDDRGQVLGTFCLMDSEPHEWTPQDIQIVATLAKAASSEIQLRKLRNKNSISQP